MRLRILSSPTVPVLTKRVICVKITPYKTYMKKIISLVLAAIFLSACSGEEAITEKIPHKQPELKQVEVFDLQNDQASLELKRSGTVFPITTAYVTPQITGKIKDIRVKVGQTVREGDLLLSLGDSYSTDILDLQLETAQKSENLSKNVEYYTQISGNETLQSLQLSVDLAQEGYINAQKSKENAQDLFEEQYDNAEIEVDNAEKGYKAAKKAYSESKKMQDEAEDTYETAKAKAKESTDYSKSQDEKQQLEDFIKSLGQPSAEAIEQQLNTAVKASKAQVESSKLAKDLAENRLEQAENYLDQLEASYQSQLDQLDFAIEAADIQYQSNINQLQGTSASTELQNTYADQQSLQSESTLKNAALSQKSKELKAPISGKISDIAAEIGNLATPGQILITIEDDQQLLVRTSLNPEEASLIRLGDQVEIEKNGKTTNGIITEISPSINQVTKKIQIEITLVKDGEIQNGSFVKVNFKAKIKATFIPLNSIFIKNQKKFVRILDEDNIIQEQEVEVAKIIGTFIEITTGLNGKEKIVAYSTAMLSAGDKVQILNSKEDSEKIKRLN